MKLFLKRFSPLVILIFLILAFYLLRRFNIIQLESLLEKHLTITNYVNAHPILSPFIFMCCYFITALLFLPIGFVLSLIAGYLFIQPLCTLYIVIPSLACAILTHFIFHSALGGTLREKSTSFLAKLDVEFHSHKISYILFLRFSPFLPFGMVNVILSFFHISMKTYIWTTVVGVLPSAFAISEAGKGLGTILLHKNAPVFNPHIKVAFLSIALISLLPIFLKKKKKNQEKS